MYVSHGMSRSSIRSPLLAASTVVGTAAWHSSETPTKKCTRASCRSTWKHYEHQMLLTIPRMRGTLHMPFLITVARLPASLHHRILLLDHINILGAIQTLPDRSKRSPVLKTALTCPVCHGPKLSAQLTSTGACNICETSCLHLSSMDWRNHPQKVPVYTLGESAHNRTTKQRPCSPILQLRQPTMTGQPSDRGISVGMLRSRCAVCENGL